MSKPANEPITGQERAKLSQTLKAFGCVPGEVDDLMLAMRGTREEASQAVIKYLKAVAENKIG